MFTLFFLVGSTLGLLVTHSPLPYPLDALEPVLSRETVDIHYNKHHGGYVKKLNAILNSDDFFSSQKTLMGLVIQLKAQVDKTKPEELTKSTQKAYNFGAQVLAHELYWESLSPQGGGQPEGALAEQIVNDFGSFESFKEEFTKTAAGHFGSGWVSLYASTNGKLIIQQNHDTGLVYNWYQIPILTVDVWEHAYYVDYRNRRAEYLEKYWTIVNWKSAEEKFVSHVDNTKEDL